AASLGDAVRRVREARQMTLRELATKIGVSAPFLSDVEHNRRRTDKLGELAAVLEVDLERLRRLDPRLPDDLKQWMDANPEIVSFLESLRQSGRDVRELIQSFRVPGRRAAPRRPVGLKAAV